MTVSLTLRNLIQKEFADPARVEVIINGVNSLACYDNQQQCHLRSSPYSDVACLISDLQDLAFGCQTRLDPFSPAAGGDLHFSDPGATGPVQLRWHAMITPVVREGAVVSFRRHRFEELTLQDFAISAASLAALLALYQQNCPIFICGDTGSGKTSFLNALLKMSPAAERVVVLEQSAEMGAMGSNWTRLIARSENAEGYGRFDLSELFTHTLRIRPDRVVLGEIRGHEAVIAFQTMISGHKSLITTLHVAAPDMVLPRLYQLTGKGANAAIDWLQIFALVRPLVVMLKRGAPHRVEGLYRYSNGIFAALAD
jgi:pilus assembly protein CpaF